MSGSIVTDASVALKWIFDEVLSDTAQRLFLDTTQPSDQLYVPPHFMGEVFNGIYQKRRTTDPTKHVDEVEARVAIRDALRWPIQVVTPPGLYEQAFDFANVSGLPSMYDSIYVVLA